MEKKNTFEVTLSMMPDTITKLSYANFFHLDDNFEHTWHRASYDGEPVKLMFATLLFCTEGSGILRINLQDYRMQPNDILIIPPGSIVERFHLGDDMKIGFINITGKSDQNFMSNGNIQLYMASVIKNDPMLVHCRPQTMEQLVKIYHMLRSVVSDDQLTFKDNLISYFLQAMVTYWMNDYENNNREQQVQLTRNEQILSEFINLVRNNYKEHREVNFYANQMCITPKYLGVVVTHTSGKRPIEWIRDFVILDAKAMIISRNYTMQQISEILNFANPSFFGKYFKEAVGCSPGTYASKNKKRRAEENAE